MPAANAPWTGSEDAAMSAMREMGATREEIARALGRSLAAVKRRVAELQARGVRLPSVSHLSKAGAPAAPARAPQHDLHLALIAKANNGKGFPFYDLPATRRRAA